MYKQLKSAIFQTGPGCYYGLQESLFAYGFYEFLAMLKGKTIKGLFF